MEAAGSPEESLGMEPPLAPVDTCEEKTVSFRSEDGQEQGEAEEWPLEASSLWGTRGEGECW